MGAGWNITGPDPTPFAVAGVLELDWDEANRPHTLRIELLTDDGHPVLVPTPVGDRPVDFGGNLEVGRPPGSRPGTYFNVPIAMNINPMPIPPGGRYVWRFSINGVSQDDWRLPFSTRAPAPAPPQPGALPA